MDCLTADAALDVAGEHGVRPARVLVHVGGPGGAILAALNQQPHCLLLSTAAASNQEGHSSRQQEEWRSRALTSKEPTVASVRPST